MEEKDIKGLLKPKFEHYEEDPGADLWLAIEAEIHPGRKRRAAWWMYAAVAASVAILFFSLFWLLDQPSSTQNNTSPIAETDSVPGSGTITPEPQLTDDPHTPESLPDNVIERAPQFQKTGMGAPEKKSLKQLAKDSSQKDVSPAKKQIDENFASLNIETLNNPGFSPLTASPLPATAPAKVKTPVRKNNQPIHQDITSSHNTINLNELKVEDAVSFASNTLEKWKNSPIDVYQEKGPDGETKTYQVDIFNLRITKKTHKRVVKQL
ncbi:MAG: hypothetical protein R3D00_29370 [Bacteroidia bacterium]